MNRTSDKNNTVFCNVTPCSLAKVHLRLRVAYCLHLQGITASPLLQHSVILLQTSRRHSLQEFIPYNLRYEKVMSHKTKQCSPRISVK
jgi:hypothetical protein